MDVSRDPNMNGLAIYYSCLIYILNPGVHYAGNFVIRFNKIEVNFFFHCKVTTNAPPTRRCGMNQLNYVHLASSTFALPDWSSPRFIFQIKFTNNLWSPIDRISYASILFTRIKLDVKRWAWPMYQYLLTKSSGTKSMPKWKVMRVDGPRTSWKVIQDY